jgi:hypothetical protein
MLDAHPNISCGPETHFLEDMRHIVQSHWNLLSRYGFEKSYWHEKIRSFFSSVKADYMEKRNKSRWIEKTPRYVKHLDFINDVFDDCLVIQIIRNGYDVVLSWKQRSGYKQAMKSAWGEWRNSVRKAQAFGKKHPERYHELRYEDLVRHPESTMRDLLSFLDEPWDPAVINYDQADHDVADHYWDYTESRRDTTEESSKIYASRIGKGKQKLNPVLRKTLQVRSGSLLKELGYY